MALRPENPDELRGIALCAGVGGLELGLHIAEPRYRTVCFVEREAFAAANLVARMEDQTLDYAPIWDDVKSFDGRPWRDRVHILTGGYPCQPFSFAGRRRGRHDPRHLWPDIARIVDEVRPRFCFFENVDGHLNLGASKVIEDLRKMGYGVKAGLFSALEVGAPHLRKRLFILAYADDLSLLQSDSTGAVADRVEASGRSRTGGLASSPREGREVVDFDVASGDQLERAPDRRDQLPLFPPAPFEVGRWGEILKRRPDLQPELFGLDHGLANRVDRSHAAGNGVVSLAAARAWRTLVAP